jgi:hypothetical protein
MFAFHSFDRCPASQKFMIGCIQTLLLRHENCHLMVTGVK